MVNFVPAAIVASGRYGAAEMAAVGATLGVLLFICLVVIVVLVVHVKRERADWKKIYETSMSQRSVSPKLFKFSE